MAVPMPQESIFEPETFTDHSKIGYYLQCTMLNPFGQHDTNNNTYFI